MGDAGRRIEKVTALVNNTGGTASDTLADVPGTYTEATLANQLASLAVKVNQLIAALQAAQLMEE